MLDFHTHAFVDMKLPLIIRTPLAFRRDAMLPTEAEMRTVLAYFDNAFFLGLIGDVSFHWDRAKCSSINAIGVSYYDDEVNRHAIALHPEMLWKSTNPGPYMLGVLLHECCHAFLSTYCCRKHTRSCPRSCREDVKRHIGTTGHGTAWTRLATHVEAMAKEYLDEGIDLHIQDGMCREFMSSARIPIRDEGELIRCHRDSQEMLTRFCVLAELPLDVVRSHVNMRDWWAEH